jgi:hypothetical protein
MPKAMLSFKLPEEQAEFRNATQAGDMHSVLWEIDQYLRGQVKYCDHPPAISATYQAVRDRLWEELNARSITLE